MKVYKKKNKVHLNKTDYKKTRKDNRVKGKLNMIFVSLVALCICILMLSGYTHIAELQKEIMGIDAEIVKLDQKKNELLLKLEEIKDSGWIEEEAKLRMNMRKARKDQIIYLDIKH